MLRRTTAIAALVLLVVVLDSALAFSLPVPPIQGQTKADTEWKPTQNENSWYPVEITFGFLTAFFTGLIALYAVLQYRDNRRSNERQLRAYVAIENANLVSDIAIGKPIEIQIAVKNYGRTPAYKCIGSVNCAKWEFTGDKPMDFMPHDLSPEPFGVLQPGHTLFKSRISPPLTKEQVVGLATGKLAVWLFGQFTYDMAFDIPRRTTKFRYFLAKPEGVNEISHALGISQYGNDSD